jgi:hypothetical protein
VGKIETEFKERSIEMMKKYVSPDIKLVEFDMKGKIMTDPGDGDIVDNETLHDWTETSADDGDMPF